MTRGDPGINPLDSACKEHDIAYSKFRDLENRHIADKALAERAWERVTAKDSTIGEKANAWLVTNAMKAKLKMGGSLRKRPKTKHRAKKKCNTKIFTAAVKKATRVLKKVKPVDIEDAIQLVKKSMATDFKRKNLNAIPRIIPVPKVGGFLPLIPILGAIAKLGGLISTGVTIGKLVKNVLAAKENKPNGPVTIGNGLYLKPYRSGYGFFLRPYSKN